MNNSFHKKDSVGSVEDLSDEQFLQIFKISRTVFMYLFGEIKHFFKAPRSNAVTPMTRLACCLQILANRLNQNILRQNISALSVSQPVVSRSVTMVLNSFERRICPMWITFPATDEEKAKCKKKFLDNIGLADVIGCVACLSVAVLPFINNQQRFGSPDGTQTINVQLVCDYDMKILSVDPRYPGGVPARDIWSVSAEKEELERCYHNKARCCLLANSNYPIQPWLITPFRTDIPLTEKEINFNKKHAKAMLRMSKCLSILQDKFEILGSARYPAEKMCKIVNACCALYNIALENNCFDDLLNIDDNFFLDSTQEDEFNNSKNGNPYWKFGSQVRDDMMEQLSDK